jgi:hypothetical protein
MGSQEKRLLVVGSTEFGARATRSTHPLVLDHFAKFFSAAVGKPIEVDNPFIWKSKGDVVRSIVARRRSGCPSPRWYIACRGRRAQVSRIEWNDNDYRTSVAGVTVSLTELAFPSRGRSAEAACIGKLKWFPPKRQCMFSSSSFVE